MNPKRVAIVSYHMDAHSSFRPQTFIQAFRDLRFEVDVVYASWDHLSKSQRQLSWGPGVEATCIGVSGYTKNLSLRRVFSHLVWSYKLLGLKARYDHRRWDHVLVLCPPSMSLLGLWWVPTQKLWVDVVDLWPEALPLKSPILKFVFDASLGWVWRWLRQIGYRQARGLSVAARFFEDHIGLESHVHWLGLPPSLCYDRELRQSLRSERELSYQKEIRIVYLGSMNFVTDLDSFVVLLKKLDQKLKVIGRRVVLDLIGKGERKEWFLNQVQQSGVQVFDHGAIFETQKKAPILAKAHWAYNGFVDTTAVGLSYKSMDYLSAGLPLLNSVQGDLNDWVLKHRLGLNFQASSLHEVSKTLSEMTFEECESLGRYSRQFYEEVLSWPQFLERCRRIVSA